MQTVVPIALIPPHDKRLPSKPNATSDYKIGILILAITWTIFIVGVGAVLNIWTIPNTIFQNVSEGEVDEYGDPMDDFPVKNYYSLAILLIPVMLWLWSVVSWTALKLFKHSKGANVVKTQR
jgi:hypothetical protein